MSTARAPRADHRPRRARGSSKIGARPSAAASRIDSLLAAASRLPRCGGPPESPLRELFALQLAFAEAARETALQTGATTIPAARPAPTAAPARVASDAASSSLAPGLQVLETGYRHLQPDFLTAAEARRLRATAALGMVQAFRRGSQTVLSLVPELEARLRASGDAEGFGLPRPAARVRRQCEEDRRQPPGAPLLPCGALLIRLEPPGAADAALPSWDLAARQRYSEPHVDKENVRAYDASALVYLSNHGEHFGGGAFAFHDAAADVQLAPREGTLLTFSSGAENLHSVAPVEWGCRVALACWFTTDPRCATAALVAAPPAPPPAAWSLLDGESALLSAAITTLALPTTARARGSSRRTRAARRCSGSSPRWATRAPARNGAARRLARRRSARPRAAAAAGRGGEPRRW